jgi:ABC-type multidrug transport system permease subunit
MKNLKYRFREPQQYLFLFGFPIMFTFVFWFMFKDVISISPLHNQFDIFIWGLISFVVAFSTQSASVAFSQEKDKGTLKRLMTTPVGTRNIFIGFITSEIILLILQVLVIYSLGFFLLGGYYTNLGILMLNFLMYMLLGVFFIGVGLILAATLSAKLAGQLPMLVVMPIVFLSGIFVPFDNPILYGNPVFWVSAFTREMGFSGKTLFDTIEIIQLSGIAIDTGIPIILSIPLTIFFAFGFLLIGLILFKRKLGH